MPSRALALGHHDAALIAGVQHIAGVYLRPQAGQTDSEARFPEEGLRALAEAGYQVEEARKAFVTSSHGADLFSFTARHDQDNQLLTGFIVEWKHLTCEMEGQWDGLGMRGNDSCSVVFTGFIPNANVVGQPGDWRQIRSFHIPFVYLTYTPVYLGIAQGAFEEVGPHVTQRAPRLAQI